MEQTQTPHTAVVIATLDEEEGVGPTIEEIKKFLGNPYILVVDGWSHDRTVEIAKNMGAEILFQEGRGKGNALRHGIQQLGLKVRYVVFTDADYTYPAEYIPKMIEILEHNPDVGMVIGNRFSKEFSFKDASNGAFYTGNRLLAFAQHVVNGIKLVDPLSGLRVVRYEILKDWKPKSKGFDVEAEMNYRVERSGYKTTEIPIQYRPRLGEKKLKLKHGFTILKRIVSESVVEHTHSAFYG
jgi:dolichol-phosphate mannosyltransferase